MPINNCDNTNPLTGIPVNSTYEYTYENTSTTEYNRPHQHIQQQNFRPIPQVPMSIPALGGDVQGRLTETVVTGIRNIPVVCPIEIKENQVLVTNKHCQFELKSMIDAESLTVENAKGLILVNGELKVDYTALVSTGDLITTTFLENNYISTDGGTFVGDVVLDGNLKINELTSASTQSLVLDSSGNVNVQPNTIKKPETTSDASAENNSIYFSSDTNKLCYKDPSGTVNELY